MKSANLNSTFHIKLIELSASPSGFGASELTGFSPEQVRRAAEALVKAGKIMRAKVSSHRVRYFANDILAKGIYCRPGAGAGAALCCRFAHTGELETRCAHAYHAKDEDIYCAAVAAQCIPVEYLPAVLNCLRDAITPRGLPGTPK